MSQLDALRHRLLVLIKGHAYDDEVRAELRFHRELESAAGAGASLGNETYYREEVRRMTLLSWLDRIRQDATYAARGLRRSPGFTIAVALTLGLGVGVNAAMYSLLSRLYVLPPSGVVRPHEVRRLYATMHYRDRDVVIPSLEYPQFVALRAAVDSSIRLGIYVRPDSQTIHRGNARATARVSIATADFFSVLGVHPAIGRFFAPEEQHVETPSPVMVISDALWRREFNASPGVLGQHIKVGVRDVTIIGVTPRDFAGIDIDRTEAWLPISMYDPSGGYNGLPWYKTMSSVRIVARPRSFADEQQLTVAGMHAVRPVRVPGWGYDSTITLSTGPILEALGPLEPTSDMRVATRIAAVVIVVLLIAAANVATLLLLRTARRRHEIVVRRALGVSRLRLFEQIAVEALMIAILGAAVAAVCTLWAGTALRRLMLPNVHWAEPVLDAKTVAFILTVSVLVGLLCGLAPTLEALRLEITGTLRGGAADGRHQSRLRGALLALQVALCVMLLVGTGLFVRSFQNVISIGTGFDTSDRVLLRPMFENQRAHAVEVRNALPIVTEHLRAVDGVDGVAYMNIPPITGSAYRTMFLPGHDTLPQLVGGLPGPSMAAVSPGYFSAIGLRLVTGRDFMTADGPNAARVAIVSRRLATLYWPGENALGKCLLMNRRDAPCTQVVGIADDAHHNSLIEAPSTQYYTPIAQTDEQPYAIVVHYRAARRTAIVRDAEAMMRSLMPDLETVYAPAFDSVTDRELRPWRLGATLFGALGVLALVVAAVGVYSVVAYGVSQRVREMGIRVALGAQRSNIVDLVVGDGLRAVLLGAALGLGASALFGRLIQALLFGVEALDVSVHLTALIVLLVVAAAACAIPAWRAAGVNPVDALRTE